MILAWSVAAAIPGRVGGSVKMKRERRVAKPQGGMEYSDLSSRRRS